MVSKNSSRTHDLHLSLFHELRQSLKHIPQHDQPFPRFNVVTTRCTAADPDLRREKKNPDPDLTLKTKKNPDPDLTQKKKKQFRIRHFYC